MKFDSIQFELTKGKDVTVFATAAIRINDCDFKENIMSEGETLDVNFPLSAYLVVRAGKADADWELKYKFVKGDPSDYTSSGNSISNLSWNDFSKTSLFKYICYAVLGLFVVVAILVGVFYVYKKRFGKILYKV